MTREENKSVLGAHLNKNYDELQAKGEVRTKFEEGDKVKIIYMTIRGKKSFTIEETKIKRTKYDGIQAFYRGKDTDFYPESHLAKVEENEK